MACPVCGEDQFTLLREIDSTLRTVPNGLDRATHVHVSVDQCAVCGLLRSIDHGGSIADASVSFDASASKVRVAGTGSVSSTDELSLLRRRLPASLLDVGCGDGTTALPLAKHAADVLGIDIARRTVAKYRESLRIPSSVQRRRAMRQSA